MSFLVLRSSVNEIHLCPEMRAAEASVILYCISITENQNSSKKGFWHTDPIFRSTNEAVFEAIGGSLSNSYLWLLSLVAKWDCNERICISRSCEVSNASIFWCSLSSTGKCLLSAPSTECKH